MTGDRWQLSGKAAKPQSLTKATCPGHGPHFPFAQRRLRFQSHHHPLSLFWVPGRKLQLSFMELLPPALMYCKPKRCHQPSGFRSQVPELCQRKSGRELGFWPSLGACSPMEFTQKGRLIPWRNVRSWSHKTYDLHRL